MSRDGYDVSETIGGAGMDMGGKWAVGAALVMAAAAAPANTLQSVEVRTSDVTTFYQLYDAAN